MGVDFFLKISYTNSNRVARSFITLGTKPSLVLGFSTLRRYFMELKAPLSFDQQLDRLKFHGMTIENECEAKKILSQINYYRFTGYALQYRKQADNSDYIKSVTFNRIYQIYKFDEDLRHILRKYIEIIEVYYKTQIAYEFSMKKCTIPPHDQHYDEKYFYNKRGYNDVMNSFKKEENYYKDSLIVQHHKLKYNSKMPLWVIVELMSFSNVSKLYNSMYVSDKRMIANKMGIGEETLENHLHCLSVLRNKCAHAARLYNTTFNPPAKFSSSFLRKHPELKNDTLFAYIYVLSKRLPESSMRDLFLIDLYAVLEKYDEFIGPSEMGFPKEYKKILSSSVNEKTNFKKIYSFGC